MFRNSLIFFTEFVKRLFSEHDIASLGLNINKTQTKILMIVDENPEKSMSEISEMVGLEKSSFSRSVEHLVQDNFLLRRSAENNRKKIFLSLTPKGKKSAKIIRDDLDEYLDSLMNTLTPKEKKEFINALNTTAAYIKKIMK